MANGNALSVDQLLKWMYFIGLVVAVVTFFITMKVTNEYLKDNLIALQEISKNHEERISQLEWGIAIDKAIKKHDEDRRSR